MEIRQLKYFYAVATELSFTNAAKKLHISQPPLSYQIANLESELGVRLFIRNSRSVELSEAGKALFSHASAILERVEDARAHVMRISKGAEGRVSIGLSGSHFLGPLPKLIKHFREYRPKVEVVLHEMKPSEHIQALKDGRLNISISRTEQDDDDISSSLLWRDEVVVAVPIQHPMAGGAVKLSSLKNEEFVALQLDSSAFARKAHEVCISSGFAPKVVQQAIEPAAVLNLVAAGLGVALLPESLVRLRPDAVKACAIEDPLHEMGFSADVYLLRRKLETSPATMEFATKLEEWTKASDLQAPSTHAATAIGCISR